MIGLVYTWYVLCTEYDHMMYMIGLVCTYMYKVYTLYILGIYIVHTFYWFVHVKYIVFTGKLTQNCVCHILSTYMVDPRANYYAI